MTISAFLDHFDRKTRTGDQWLVRCPTHEDRQASLAIREGDDGRLLLKCHAGCASERIVSGLGLKLSDLFPPKPAGSSLGTIIATYDYNDAAGVLQYQVVRYEPKTFRQRCPDGKGGWIYKLNGVLRVVYRLPELQGREAVVVVEGEKDVDALWKINVPATTSVSGAGKWRDEYTAQLKAAGVKRVRIIPDNDEPGRAHADQVARSCQSVGLDARIVTLPDLPEKGDVSDYLAAHSAAELLALLKAAPEYTPPPVTTATPASSEPPRAAVLKPVDPWPEPLRDAAYFGVFGDIVRAIEPHTEADPAAILVQLIVMFGSVIGRTAHFRAENDLHYLNLFAAVVGLSSKGRKGVSTGRARQLYEPCDSWWMANCQKSGLSSGEGLIWAVRDQIEKQTPIKVGGRPTGEYDTVIEDPGVIDKRLLVIESELASTLRVLAREGNTLSALMRQAWDGLDLRVLTKNSPAKCTGPHISVIANITCDEVRRYLDATEAANGFGNRFLWVCAKRSKLLPDGGGVPDLASLAARVKSAIETARTVGHMRRDADASTRWHQVYASLSEGRPGLLGAMTGRAEAQVMRLACVYALSDLSPVVRLVHLEAALELWRYCFASARYIFGQSLGSPLADVIWRAGVATPAGLTRSDLHGLVGRNRPVSEIDRALEVLEANHMAHRTRDDDTGGKPAERWQFTAGAYEKDEFNEESRPDAEGEGASFVNFVNFVDPSPAGSAPAVVPERFDL